MSEKKTSWLKPSLDWLLIFVPIACALRFVPSLDNPTALFIVSCIAVIPLAGWMGKGTEHLAEHLGPGAGGLLSAGINRKAQAIGTNIKSQSSDGLSHDDFSSDIFNLLKKQNRFV